MRRGPIVPIVVVVLIIVAFIAVYIVRRGLTLPTSAVLAYAFKTGNTAAYDVSLVVTNTVGSGPTASTSKTTVDVATHVTVLSATNDTAQVRVSLDQPTVRVDGTLIPTTLKVTTAELQVEKSGRVDSLRFPGASRNVSIITDQGTNRVSLGNISAEGGTDPLENVLLLAQGSLPAMPSGTIKIGQHWSRASVINAPYMLLEAALANSTLDGFTRENELNVARINTQTTTPIDLQTSPAEGTPLHLTGSQTFSMQSYFAPDLGVLIRSTGSGHVDITQQVSAGISATAHPSGTKLIVTTPQVRTITDMSFTAKLRQ